MGCVHKCQQDQNRASENWEHQPISEQPITLQGQTLREVQSFPYLGSEVDQSGKVQKVLAVRLEKAGRVYQMWRKKAIPE